MHGQRAQALSVDAQKVLVGPFFTVLKEEGLCVEFEGEDLFLCASDRRKQLIIYPAMWKEPSGESLICISDAAMKYARPIALKAICAAFGR